MTDEATTDGTTNGSTNAWTSIVTTWLERDPITAEMARHWANDGPKELAVHVEILVGAFDDPSLRCDLLEHALEQVDWREVAEHCVEAAPESATV